VSYWGEGKAFGQGREEVELRGRYTVDSKQCRIHKNTNTTKYRWVLKLFFREKVALKLLIVDKSSARLISNTICQLN
jgi:hypothetical protein